MFIIFWPNSMAVALETLSLSTIQSTASEPAKGVRQNNQREEILRTHEAVRICFKVVFTIHTDYSRFGITKLREQIVKLGGRISLKQ
jgi:hypothetical protein